MRIMIYNVFFKKFTNQTKKKIKCILYFLSAPSCIPLSIPNIIMGIIMLARGFGHSGEPLWEHKRRSKIEQHIYIYIYVYIYILLVGLNSCRT